MWMFWVPVTHKWFHGAPVNTAIRCLVEKCGGITVLGEGHGYYVSPLTGNTTREGVEVWLVLGLTELEAAYVADWLRRHLDQEEVLFGRVHGEFHLMGDAGLRLAAESRDGGPLLLPDSVEGGEEALSGEAAHGGTLGAGGVLGGSGGDRACTPLDSTEGEPRGCSHSDEMHGAVGGVGIVAGLCLVGTVLTMAGATVWDSVWRLW